MLNYYTARKISTKNFIVFTSEPNALWTFLNLNIKINKKITEAKRPIEILFCMLSIFKV